jgi:hypothetical protein
MEIRVYGKGVMKRGQVCSSLLVMIGLAFILADGCRLLFFDVHAAYGIFLDVYPLPPARKNVLNSE